MNNSIETKLRNSGRRGSVMRIQRCQESLDRLYMDSNIFQSSSSDLASSVKPSDVTTGRIIGKGAFGQIRSLRNLLYTQETSLRKLSTINSGADEPEDNHQTQSDSTSEKRRVSTPRKYVMKQMRRSIVEHGDKTTITSAAIDLVKESHFLQLLSHHENIVSFHSSGGSAGSRDFYILIEKVDKTLDDLIQNEWKNLWYNIEHKIRSDSVQRYLIGEEEYVKRKRYDLAQSPKELKKVAKQKFLSLRFEIVAGIASGLAFLHEHKDLKPSNIGISINGVPQIFDFGLARELKDKDRADNEGNYNLTNMVGTLRYMSPEIYKCKPYGLTADVYSFTLILYEIMILEKPFNNIHPSRFEKSVFEKNKRPKLTRNIPKNIRGMMQKGWNSDPKTRPSAEEIGMFARKLIAED